MSQKTEMNIIKDIINLECGDNVKAIIAEKPGWLLLKTSDKMKTIGCIRLNKNSFVTLYIDTKENIMLENELPKSLDSFKDSSIDIKSRQTGNFVQNKIKLFSENQIDLVVQALKLVFDEKVVKTGKRIRNSSNSQSIA